MMKQIGKRELRKEVLTYRDALSWEERQEKSQQITERVLEMGGFKKANKVLLYNSMRSEVETERIDKKARALSKEVYYPRVQGDKMEFYLVDEGAELEISRFGVREPKIEGSKQFVPKIGDIIFVIMPGVVFDQAGNRIGYGGGYYDKYLHWLEQMIESENICKAAVAYECQMVDEDRIERKEHDRRPDYIVTEERIYEVSD